MSQFRFFFIFLDFIVVGIIAKHIALIALRFENYLSHYILQRYVAGEIYVCILEHFLYIKVLNHLLLALDFEFV